MISHKKYKRAIRIKHLLLVLCSVLVSFSGFSQTGVVNNGAKMIVSSGAIVKISGTGADYTNNSLGGSHGRIDLDGKIQLEGDWVNDATFGGVMINPNSAGLVVFNGTSLQSIGGASNSQFEYFALNNTSGLSLSSDIRIRNILFLSSGNITLNANNLIIGTGGNITGSFGTGRMIITNGTGSLRKALTGTGSFTFPVGDNTGSIEYTPVNFSLVAHSGVSNAWVGANVKNEKHPENTSPLEYLTRYWTLSSSGINVPKYDADFNYKDADIQGTESDIYAAEYDGTSRTVYSKVSTAGNILSISGLSSFADYTGVDGAPLLITISTGESDPTNTNPIPFTINFSKSVTGFTDTDINVLNGTISNFVSTNNPEFTFDVTPVKDSTVTVQVDAGVAEDISGNQNVAATTYRLNYDGTSPQIDSRSPADGATGVALNTDIEIHFDEPVTAESGNIYVYETGVGISETYDVAGAEVSGSGTAVILVDRSASLTSLEEYHIQIDATAFADEAGNYYAGISNSTDWNFTAVDGSNPEISSLSPLDNAMDVSLSTDLVITFDEDVQANSGNITLYTSDDTPIAQFDVTSDISILNDQVSIDMSSVILTGETGYYVLIDYNAIQDMGGNPFAGISNPNVWDFITEDVSDPVISSLTPDNGDTDIALNSNLQIVFNENVNINSGNVEIRYEHDNTLFESINVPSVSGDGTSTITIDPTTDFDSDTTYYVLIDPEAFIDESGNGYAGMSSGNEWIFTTVDETPPAYVEVNPTDGALDVEVNTDLEITFSENVTKNIGSITIMNDDDNTEHEVIDVSSGQVVVSGNVATISTSVDLIGETNYYVLVGESTFQDIAGNNFGGITTINEWNFYTVDNIPPEVTTYSPADNELGVSVGTELSLLFNEDVRPISGNVTIVDTDAASNHEVIDINGANVNFTGNEVSINPTSALDGLTNYHILIDATAIEDMMSNSYAGITDPTVWNFVTADASAPVVNSYSPADGATDLTNDFNLVMTFDENVFRNTGNITIYNSTTSAVHETIDVNSANVTIESDKVTINPDANFDDLNDYYVQIDYGTFRNQEGTDYAGISDALTWNFSVGDNTAPGIWSLIPIDDAVEIVSNANLEITFDEDIVANTGNIVIMNAETSAQHEVIAVSSVSINSATVTINPSIDFDNSGSYYVLIDPDAFRDLAGNSFVGIVSETAWNFTIQDQIAPSILSVTPADDAANVSVASKLEIVFDESVIANTGLVTIMDGNTIHESFDVNSLNITQDKVTINPTITLHGETEYHILIDEGVFHDLSGNAFSGISDQTTWNFSTEDVTKPTVVIRSSESGTVTDNFDITVTFSEEVIGFESSDLTLVNGNLLDFSEVTTGVVWSASIQPVSNGEVIVDIAADVAQDAAGNTNEAANSFSITYDSEVGFEDILAFELKIYAVGNRVIVEFFKEDKYQFEEGSIEIYNLIGQKIVEEEIKEFTRFETKVNHVSNVYVVKVILDDKEYSRRVYIE